MLGKRRNVAGRHSLTLHWSSPDLPRSSNGRTAAFGAVNRSSNLCRGAKVFKINNLQESDRILYGGRHKILWKTRISVNWRLRLAVLRQPPAPLRIAGTAQSLTECDGQNRPISLSEQKAKQSAKIRFIARRPEREPILSREQLAEFTRQLQMLSDGGVEKIYETAYRDCRYDRQKLPPAAIQQLVACWRVLRKFRGTALRS